MRESEIIPTLDRRVSTCLKKAIASRRLLPGAKLGERELSDIFSVGRRTVRQCLLNVAASGLVTFEHNRGAFVRKPGLLEALEIYDSLTIIEQGIAVQLAGRLNSTIWDQLRQQVERQSEAIDTEQHELANNLGEGFHSLFVSFINNTLIRKMHAQVTERTFLLRSLCTTRFDQCNLLKDHQMLIDYLEQGRLKKALRLIEVHNRSVARGYMTNKTAHSYMPLHLALGPFVETKEEEADGNAFRPLQQRGSNLRSPRAIA